MSEKLTSIFIILGCICVAMGFVIGAFILHWILGIITLGFSLMVIGALFSTDDYDDWI